MRRFASSMWILGTLVTSIFLCASAAQAQATRTWVSGVGDDVNPCSRTAPCKTFAGAISKTALNGEINCLDPGGFGTVTITKSITIDCKNTHGSILNTSLNAVIINFDQFTNASETRKTVRLRGLAMNGADLGTAGVRIIGTASANSDVFIEDTLIDGNFGGIARGVSDERLGGGELTVRNTTIRNMGQTGFLISPGVGTGSMRLDVVIDNVGVHNSNYGIAVGNGARVMISNSLLTGNTVAGLEVEGPIAASEVNLSNSVSSNNGKGIEIGPGTTTVRLSNSDISFNAIGITGASLSHGNNRITGNGTLGTSPTLLSPALQ